jgi:hypothetical protein
MHPNAKPKVPIGNRMIIAERFFGRYQQVPCEYPEYGDCHRWLGSLNNAGYGLVGFQWADEHQPPGARYRGMIAAHRLALMHKLGRELQEGVNANHLCHRRDCVNPAHLYEGTQAETIRHARSQGRKFSTGKPTGTRHTRPYKRNAK